MASPIKPTFNEAFQFWLKLGFISFGGPAGQIAIMHQFIVEQKKWISETRFLHALNYCMLLPGPEAQQLAIYIGWLLHGNRGGFVAGLLFVLPSVFTLLGLSIAYVQFGSIPAVSALFIGLKPAIVAVVALALFKMSKKSLSSAIHFAVAILSFILIFFFKVPFPIIILCAIAIGIIYGIKNSSKSDSINKIDRDEELKYYLNNVHQEKVPTVKFRNAKLLTIGALCWILPLLIIIKTNPDPDFWTNLILFFSKAALVTFGGAYAVLPYVAQVSVDKFAWLGRAQMMDGLALGESTPGPLIMILAFVGFMAGYNLHEASILHGTIALLLTTWYTFLPCFLFILIGAPYVEKSNNFPWVKKALTIISATVAGVVLNLLIFFAEGTLFTEYKINWFSAAWMLISFFALYKLKIKMIPWLGISALAGLGYYLMC